MPYINFNQEKSFGDLIVEVEVTFPDTLDTNMILLLRDILDVHKDLELQDDAEEKELTVYSLIPFTSEHHSPDYYNDNNSDYYNDECDDDSY